MVSTAGSEKQMRLEEFLLKHYNDPLAEIDRASLLEKIVLSGFDNPEAAKELIPEDPTCGQLLEIAHDITDEAKLQLILSRMVGAKFLGHHYVRVTAILSGILVVVVLIHSLHAIYYDGDPEDNGSALKHMAESITEIVRDVVTESQHPEVATPPTPAP